MGCFSYRCSVCDDPINSDSHSGEHCVLFLLEKGRVLEWMQGQYNSYGRVFNGDCTDSMEWVSLGTDDEAWGRIVDMHYNDDPNSGLAAYHTECWEAEESRVIEVSEGDPEQGWGKYKHPTTGKCGHKVVNSRIVWTKAEKD